MKSVPDQIPNIRRQGMPERYSASIERQLLICGYTLKEPRALAKAVLRLSNHYIENPEATTPWREPWAIAASLAYYFPLNYARAAQVAKEARRLQYFSGIDRVFDFGSGLGAALHGFKDHSGHPFEAVAMDLSTDAHELASALDPAERLRFESPDTDLDREPSGFRPHAHRSLVLASYVLTELNDEVPKWWSSAEAIAIIEPSTQIDSRRLIALRAKWMGEGFHPWGPCTHEDACPLLTHSKKDWCHDRIHLEAPSWMEEIESYLPMKNRTITMSYLLMRRQPRAPSALGTLARLIGDRMDEKGKTRQSVCRGREREFLAWFPQRMKERISFERGNLLRLKEPIQTKSNELRIESSADATELKPEMTI